MPPFLSLTAGSVKKLLWDTARLRQRRLGHHPRPVLLARMRPACGADVPPAFYASTARMRAHESPSIAASGVEGLACRGDRRWGARGDVQVSHRHLTHQPFVRCRFAPRSPDRRTHQHSSPGCADHHNPNETASRTCAAAGSPPRCVPAATAPQWDRPVRPRPVSPSCQEAIEAATFQPWNVPTLPARLAS
eukprot:SAG25_NODE_251_length_10976_cov_6.972787_4_plen_191_part_00